MDWLSQNWVWLAFVIVAIFMMRRAAGGHGGCCGGAAPSDKGRESEQPASKEVVSGGAEHRH